MIFDIPQETSSPGNGKLMASEPFLTDRFFSRSVVLITEHNENGTMGFILNKPTDIKITDAITDFPPIDINLYFGGPVQPETLHFIHNIGAEVIPESVEVAKGVFWGGDFEVVKSLLSTGVVSEKSFRFFMGYSGWEPEQILAEITDNNWIIIESDPEFPFDKNVISLWRKVVLSKGKDYAALSNIPDDPGMN